MARVPGIGRLLTCLSLVDPSAQSGLVNSLGSLVDFLAAKETVALIRGYEQKTEKPSVLSKTGRKQPRKLVPSLGQVIHGADTFYGLRDRASLLVQIT